MHCLGHSGKDREKKSLGRQVFCSLNTKHEESLGYFTGVWARPVRSSLKEEGMESHGRVRIQNQLVLFPENEKRGLASLESPNEVKTRLKHSTKIK